MATWKLIVEYDGTRFYGWQEQKSARTVAGELRAAAEGLLSKRVEIAGAGRTDAGVHALGQVVSLRTNGRVPPADLVIQLNDRLPPDINVLSAVEVHSAFDPRRDAVARYYLYQISQRRTAFAKRFVWWVKDNLNHTKMQEAARALIGRHDFAGFCDKRADERSTLVVVTSVEFRSDGDLLLFRIGASHFLWKMVRRVIGALVEVGRGSLSGPEFSDLLKSSGRSKSAPFDVAAHTAPPSGLFLERVAYRKNEAPGELVPVIPVARRSARL